MNWEQRFEEAFERGRFEYEDCDAAYSPLESAAYDVLCRRGYDRLYTADQLRHIIINHDMKLYKANSEFAEMVSLDGYNFVQFARDDYNMIQNMDLSQALIDKLELTANSKAPVIHEWVITPTPFF